jgi:hypothetical protein
MKKIFFIILMVLSPLVHSLEYHLYFDHQTRLEINGSDYYLEVRLTQELQLKDFHRELILAEIEMSPHDGISFILEALLSSDIIEPFHKIIENRQSFHNSLCHKIGQTVQGIYIDQEGESRVQSTILGSPELGCPGRCGPQCGIRQLRRSQYTQECLNHDLCHRTLGYYLGPCLREYWLAVHSFFFAPHCQR